MFYVSLFEFSFAGFCFVSLREVLTKARAVVPTSNNPSYFILEFPVTQGFVCECVLLAFTFTQPSEIGSCMLLTLQMSCVCHTNGDSMWLITSVFHWLLVARSVIESSQSYPVQLPDVPDKGLLSFLLKTRKKIRELCFATFSWNQHPGPA